MMRKNKKEGGDNQLYIFCVDTLFVKDTILSCSFFVEKIRIIYKSVGVGIEDVNKKINRAFDALFDEIVKIKKVF